MCVPLRFAQRIGDFSPAYISASSLFIPDVAGQDIEEVSAAVSAY